MQYNSDVDIIVHEENSGITDTIIRRCMLTTIDNPFDPFNEYDKWEQFDVDHNYNSASYLARIVRSSDELSELDQAMAIESAIDEIIELNSFGVFKKVFERT